MPKILVADDNSNIQKMVGLALKDQGIDVVAVGNGEAAVRKISDVRPDLVLADVFMPVRNGYEVCKYVKGDSSLSHIPVILLVGAFDPLDEQEAQRVGADGVLKKPFVPPDPLISMVKSALVRASAGNLNSPKPSGNSQNASATAASLDGHVATVGALPNQAVLEAESFVEEVSPPRPPDLKIEPGSQPPAFGSLLETPQGEAEDDTAFATTAAAPELMDRAWSAAEEEEEEEEGESTSSWRRDGGGQAYADEQETSSEKPAKHKREAWTPTREKTHDVLEAAAASEIVNEPAPPEKARVETPAPSTTGNKPTPAVTADGQAPKEAEKPSAGGSWFSVSSTPWGEGAQQPSPTPAWDAPMAPVANQPIELTSSVASEGTSEVQPAAVVREVPELEIDAAPTGFYNDAPVLPELVSGGESISPDTVHILREETSQVVESAVQEVPEPLATPIDKAPEAAAPDLDALVARVLAKMNPEVLQAVTREILKPVVEAMVREEIRSKKP